MKNKSQESIPYRSYILRLWQEAGAPSQEGGVWRFSLEDPNTHQRRGFACLELLTAFLQNETRDRSVGTKQNSVKNKERKNENKDAIQFKC
jgi:hypothetical protein